MRFDSLPLWRTESLIYAFIFSYFRLILLHLKLLKASSHRIVTLKGYIVTEPFLILFQWNRIFIGTKRMKVLPLEAKLCTRSLQLARVRTILV